MTVPDIVKKVFGDHATADFKLELTGTYRKWTYCVQYRETDFNFVSRLMEEEGIYYYVRHTDGHNTVVLTDSTGKHATSPGYEKIPFIAPEQVVRPELEHISSWDFSREIQPGVYVHDDYDLERPSVELKTRKVLSRSLRAERLRNLRLPRSLPAEGGRRAVRGGAHRRVRQPVRDRAGGRPTPRASPSGRCSRSTPTRATIRTANT